MGGLGPEPQRVEQAPAPKKLAQVHGKRAYAGCFLEIMGYNFRNLARQASGGENAAAGSFYTRDTLAPPF